jgi:hypothetical protein
LLDQIGVQFILALAERPNFQKGVFRKGPVPDLVPSLLTAFMPYVPSRASGARSIAFAQLSN